MIWITLEDEHIKFADDLAREHSQARERDGSVPLNGQPNDQSLILAERMSGYRAEAAVRLWIGTGVLWTIKSKVFGLPDFGGFIDVKTRKREHHRLTITPKCPSERAYLLVCATHHPRYRIVKWCWGHEAKQDRLWDDPGTGRPAWWVTEDDPIMKDPDELLALALSASEPDRGQAAALREGRRSDVRS